MSLNLEGFRIHQQSIDVAPALQRTTVTINAGEGWAVWVVPVVMVLLLLAAAGWIYLNYRNGQPFRIEASTTLPEDAAVDRIIEGYIRAGWSATRLTDGRVLFNRTTPPEILMTLLLALLSIFPALLYLMISQKRQTADLEVISANDHRTDIEILGNMTGRNGVNTAATILRELPK